MKSIILEIIGSGFSLKDPSGSSSEWTGRGKGSIRKAIREIQVRWSQFGQRGRHWHRRKEKDCYQGEQKQSEWFIGFCSNHSGNSGAISSDKDDTVPGKQDTVAQKSTHHCMLFYIHRFCSLNRVGNLPGFLWTVYPVTLIFQPAA